MAKIQIKKSELKFVNQIKIIKVAFRIIWNIQFFENFWIYFSTQEENSIFAIKLNCRFTFLLS